ARQTCGSQPALYNYAAGSQHGWICRGGVIILPVLYEEKSDGEQERPTERPVRSDLTPEKIVEQARQPERGAYWGHQQDLLGDELRGCRNNVAPGSPYIMHQLEKRPVMRHIP